ncbi:MAG: hypothetical protein ABI980_10080 [Nitrospirota bacterium]
MSPAIRVDEEVYKWLQARARPFEDTPNSVLRRLADLDSHEPDPPRSTHSLIALPRKSGSGRVGLSGQQLNEEWDVGAHHALFSRDGKWYENLERFPGALFNQEGYILFKTEKEYRDCAFLRVGQKTNVSTGISSIPGYIRKR